MKILFLSTNSFATNPRLYKEIQLAVQNEHEVEVVCFEFDNWSKPLNEALKQQLKMINIIILPARQSQLLPLIVAAIKTKLLCLLSKYFPLPLPALSHFISARSMRIIKALEKVSVPDLVIGHNPGALWPVNVAGKKFKCSTGFDVEDYHPGEAASIQTQNTIRKLMKAVLPRMTYVSFAAPLIQAAFEKEIIKGKYWLTIINYFPGNEFLLPDVINNSVVKMVWFSQYISHSRGLESILPIIASFADKAELHLYGHPDNQFYDDHLKKLSNVFIHNPISQEQLHNALATFDIGLAPDIPVDQNRDLAITNKLLAYLQAGLYVIAADTTAQQSFLTPFKKSAACYNYRTNNIAAVLEKVIVNIDTIRIDRNNRYENFKKYNWENESMKLIEVWNSL